MSTPSSPRKLGKKPSLSILSNSTLNQLNNSNVEYKPVKERVVSESTGLIKFSIQKPANNENEHEFANSSTIQETHEETKSELPSDESDDSNKLLFEMASKQRQILDLTEQLKHAKEELFQLEKRYEKVAFADIAANESFMTDGMRSIPSSPNKILNVATTLKKSTSIMNISLNPPKVNTENFAKTQKQVSDTINQISNNIQNSNIVSRGRTFFETNLSRNFQMGSGILNSIFEKDDKSDSESSVILNEDESKNFDYSVDFDIEKISKLNFNKKLNGTILNDLEEEEYADHRLSKTFTNEDYGGDAVVV